MYNILQLNIFKYTADKFSSLQNMYAHRCQELFIVYTTFYYNI